MIKELEDQKEQALSELKAAKAQKEREGAKMTKAMKKEWELFEKTLDRSHWEKAQKMWSKMEKDEIKQPMLMAHTKELYA